MRRYKAAILGYYGFGNLGDELLLTACLDMFTRCGVKRDDVVVLSNNPAKNDVNRWKFREVLKALRQSESLLIGGGGLFQDKTSVKSCVWYWAIVRLAKFLGCRVWALGQSVGSLKSRLSKMLAGDALRLCEAVHVRDENSRVIAESLGCRNIIKGCDLVLTLKPDADSSRKNGGYILVNLRPSSELDSFVKVIAPQLEGRNAVGRRHRRFSRTWPERRCEGKDVQRCRKTLGGSVLRCGNAFALWGTVANLQDSPRDDAL